MRIVATLETEKVVSILAGYDMTASFLLFRL